MKTHYKKQTDSRFQMEYDCSNLWVSAINFVTLLPAIYLTIYIYVYAEHFKWVLTQQIKDVAFAHKPIQPSLIARWSKFIRFCDEDIHKNLNTPAIQTVGSQC